MTKYKAYNPFGRNIQSRFTDRFGGVNNQGLGSNVKPSEVEEALDADDRWRGAVKKRYGYEKYISKNIPIEAFEKAFEGYCYQGDGDIYYRVDALLDYKLRPNWEDPWWFNWANVGFTPYNFADGETEGSFVSEDIGQWDAPDGIPNGLMSPGTITWRYRHIAISTEDRRDVAGLTSAGLPTDRYDSDITESDINNARGAINALYNYFCKQEVTDDMGYADAEAMRTYAGIAGGWSTYNPNHMSLMLSEMETVLEVACKYSQDTVDGVIAYSR